MIRLLMGVFASALLFVAQTGALAQSFGGAFDGMANSDKPIQIEADRLEVLDGQNVAILSGNVSVVQDTTIMKASTIKVFYLEGGGSNSSPGGNIRKIEASGKVAVRSRDNLATANKALIDMRTEIVTLTGNVVVSQGANAVSGCILTVNLKNSEAKLDPCKSEGGRVKMIFTPNSSKTN